MPSTLSALLAQELFVPAAQPLGQRLRCQAAAATSFADSHGCRSNVGPAVSAAAGAPSSASRPRLPASAFLGGFCAEVPPVTPAAPSAHGTRGSFLVAQAMPNGGLRVFNDVDGSKAEAEELAARGVELDGTAGGDAVVTVTSEQDPHSGELAVDGNKATYWASAYDPPTDSPVMMEVRLPEPRLLSGVRIDWEYPPSKFEVQVKRQGQKFETLGAMDNNMLWDTTTYRKGGGSDHVDGIRIYMHQAHSTFGDVSGHKVFGIRGIDLM